MKDEYDFSNAPRGAVAPTKGKTRITRSEVEALEHQRIAVAGELNRVLAGKEKPSKHRVKAHH